MQNRVQFSVASGNIGHAPYAFMWGEKSGLNEKGEQFLSTYREFEKFLKADGNPQVAKVLGGFMVKNMVMSGEYRKYSSSPARETMINKVTQALFASRKNCIVAFQEVGPESLKLVTPENSTVQHSAMFQLALPPADAVLESALERGNAVVCSQSEQLTTIGSFGVSYAKPSKEGDKKQTREASCSMSEIKTENETDSAKVCVASVHISGYDSRGYQLAAEPENETAQAKADRFKRLEGFKAGYEQGQTETKFYCEQVEKQARERGADVLVIVGDTNSCGITDDRVQTAGLKSRKSVFTELGFQEDDSATEGTRFDPSNPKYTPRRLDRVFFKPLTNKWKLSSFSTRVQQPPAPFVLTELSDHAIYVVGDIVLEKNSEQVKNKL